VFFVLADNMDKNKYFAVVGLGKTGYSCAYYLAQQGCRVCVFDQEQQPSMLAALQRHCPQVELVLGDCSYEQLEVADEIIISPGVSVHQPVFKRLQRAGKSIIGDVELFLRAIDVPVIAITGSNGKTTVSTWVGEVLSYAGFNVIVCGNIGAPVMEQLQHPSPDYYVLELSSFQLETTDSLHAEVSVLLNICQDHMDRYLSLSDYLEAKQRVYLNARKAILNADQPECWQTARLPAEQIFFGQAAAPHNGVYLKGNGSAMQLFYQNDMLLNATNVRFFGEHQWANAAVVFAIAISLGVPTAVICRGLSQVSGLPHRCELVSRFKGAYWINDSKATNVGAAIAAIKSIVTLTQGRLFLIAGGDAKAADLTPLKKVVANHVTYIFLLGKDAEQLQHILHGVVQIIMVPDLLAAVTQIAALLVSDDIVLLSPACASWDLFDNYQHRGQCFKDAIEVVSNE
jgi:UDP-N-acetylmuramoylalanine--D-glutamate ligase